MDNETKKEDCIESVEYLISLVYNNLQKYREEYKNNVVLYDDLTRQIVYLSEALSDLAVYNILEE
jgi:hypothetical protein